MGVFCVVTKEKTGNGGRILRSRDEAANKYKRTVRERSFYQTMVKA